MIACHPKKKLVLIHLVLLEDRLRVCLDRRSRSPGVIQELIDALACPGYGIALSTLWS